MLSEKAKGKQRAPEIESEGEQLYLEKDLVVRFTEGIPDLTLQVAEKDTARDIKMKIRDARPQLKDRRLKLILSGQLLAEDTELYSRVTSLQQRQRRATVNEGDNDGSGDQGPGITWLHCSVGPQMQDGEQEETQVQLAQLKPLRGFDRLAAAGFSEQDIANIRLQFHANSAGDYIDQDFVDDEHFDEYARSLEEQWIDSFDNGGGASLSQSSLHTSSNIVIGIVVGFFFPFLPFFFTSPPKSAVFWEDGAEHEVTGGAIFSRTTHMGIALGFSLNVMFGVWTYLLTSP